MVLCAGVPEFLKVHFLRFPTSCSAHRSPRIPESPFFEKSSAPGSEAARDKWLLQKIDFLEKFCSRQRSCPGQVAYSKTRSIFWKKVLPQAAKLPRTSGLFKTKIWKNLPQAAKLPGTSGFFKENQFSAKSSAPGSEAARDKWLLIKAIDFLEKALPQAAKLPGTRSFFKKKSIFCQKFCPRQRSCPADF